MPLAFTMKNSLSLRIISILLTTLTVLSSNAQMDIIFQHRKWMEQNYPDPDTLSTRKLLEEAVNTIIFGYREPKARNLLVKASEKVPELKRYIEIFDSEKVDCLCAATRSSLKAISDYSMTTYGDGYFTRWCEYQWLTVESNIKNTQKPLQKLIKRQQKTVAREPSTENRALMALIQLEKYAADINYELIDNSADYDWLFNLELEITDIYPVASTDSTLTRALLYYRLGQAKATPSFHFTANITAMAYPEIDGMLYQRIGNNNIYSCNSCFYYDKSLEILNHLFTSGHPYYNTVLSTKNAFYVSNFPSGEDEYNAIKRDYDYNRFYYPGESLENAIAQISMWLVDLYVGKRVTDNFKIRSTVKTLKEYLGESNPLFLNYLLNIAFISAAESNDSEWIDCLINCVDNVYKNESLKSVYFKCLLFTALYSLKNEDAVEQVKLLADEYLKLHDGTLISVACGKKLSEFYQLALFDYIKAFDLQTAYCEDVVKLMGKNSVLYFDTLENLVNVSAYKSHKTADEMYESAINDLEKSSIRQKDHFRYMFLNDWSIHKAINTCDFKGAISILQQILKCDSAQKGEGKALALISIARLKQKVGEPAETTDSLFNEAKNIIDNANFGDIAASTVYEAARYLADCGRMHDAIDMLNKAIDLYNRITGYSITDEYLDMRSMLSALYLNTNNRNMAKRIMNEDLELIESLQYLSGSPALLEQQWQYYYQIKNSYQNSPDVQFHHLQKIVNITNDIIKNTGDKDRILYSYATELLCEYIDVAISAKLTFNDVDRKLLKHDELESMLSMIKIFDEQIESSINMLLGIKKEFPDFDSLYKNNIYYKRLINTLADVYNELYPDNTLARKYMLESIELANTPGEYINAYIKLANFHQFKDNCPELSREYFNKAEKLLKETNPASIDNAMIINDFNITDYIDKKEYDKAVPYAKDTFLRLKKILDGNFNLMTTQDQYSFMDHYGDPAQPYCMLVEYLPEKLAKDTYNAIIYRTCMQLRSQKETQKAIYESTDSEIIAGVDSLYRLKNELKNAVLTPGLFNTPEGNEVTNKQVRLKTAIDRLEQKILDLTADIRHKNEFTTTWDSVRAELTDNEIAIEFMFSHKHIMALLIGNKYDSPIVVKLTDTGSFLSELDSINAKNPAALAIRLYNNKSIDLYRHLWQPLEKYLEGINTIYFSAPGILSNLSFNAIPRPDGKYLFDCYNLKQLTTTAELVNEDTGELPSSAMMTGNIYFSKKQEKQALTMSPEDFREVDTDFILTDLSDRGVAKEHFRYLPFTASEIKNIASTMNKIEIDSASRFNATERRIREMAKSSPDVIHLATHGFFIPDEHIARHIPFFKRIGTGSMMRSGIALSEAENAWCGTTENEEENDGILTAAEVSELNLNNTKLVALSACETALGNYSYEGVYGLQRGFKQAGVKSLLVSLWSVNDRSTALFMTSFYQKWINGASKQNAFRHAVETVRREYPSPFHWAPFILLDGD